MAEGIFFSDFQIEFKILEKYLIIFEQELKIIKRQLRSWSLTRGIELEDYDAFLLRIKRALWKHILPHVKQRARGNLLYGTGELKPGAL